ncbi:MAG: pyridoxamine 5'-phosphate oxidase [Prochloraceae cyanobacterium]|nr:pyridoxamine 5'-phosphate oxidase [Prochloraceae cyanobacterium]
MNLSISDLRQNYTLAGLRETDASRDAIAQFATWFQQALDADLKEPNAMTLATLSPDGFPTARIVLLKHFDTNGFVFYTNYKSNKGQDLERNPRAALVFWWAELERQVRIEGTVERISDRDSDEYFNSRPRDSQLGAWVSSQSEVIADRQVLEQKFSQLQQQYANKNIPRPTHWGGFRIIPAKIEFWQGRPSRLHDRLRYRSLEGGDWLIERLSP